MKRSIFVIGGVLVIAFVIVRIWNVNQAIDIPPIHIFNMKEEVAIERDKFLDDYENMDGYTVTVKEAEIIPYDEYLRKYDYEEDSDKRLFEPDDFSFPEMIYDLHVTIKNTNRTDNPNEESGIAFLNYHLIGTDFLLQINSELYGIANPKMADLDNYLMSFRLRPDSEMDFHLPFYFSPSSIFTPIQVNAIKKDDVYLTVSKYPNAKLILIE